MSNVIVSSNEEVGCPKCGHSFPLSEGLSRHAIERHAEDFERALAERRRAMEAEVSAEAKRRAEREAAAAREKFELELTAARQAIGVKDSMLEKARGEELLLRRKLVEVEEKNRNRDLEYQRKLDEERKHIEARARGAAGEEFARREAQLKAQMESAQREAADLKRKLEQGSQQTQGEALELGLEAMLKAAFPMDDILPVPKGVNGADLLQRVRSPSGQPCGTIVWETKQTKAWSNAWLPKLKDDQQAVGAEVAVLVTAAMPRDSAEPFIAESGVWVARYEAARSLALVLRSALLDAHKIRVANAGRSEKMELVYSYITSPQFAQRVRSIVEGFDALRRDLDAEKAAMTRIWAKREKQLQRMTTGMLNVVGDLQGIGEGAAMGAVAALPAEANDASLTMDL